MEAIIRVKVRRAMDLDQLSSLLCELRGIWSFTGVECSCNDAVETRACPSLSRYMIPASAIDQISAPVSPYEQARGEEVGDGLCMMNDRDIVWFLLKQRLGCDVRYSSAIASKSMCGASRRVSSVLS